MNNSSYNEIKREFVDRALIRGLSLYFKPNDVIFVIEKCRERGYPILGIDGFCITKNTTQPSLAHSITFEDSSVYPRMSKWDASIEFIKWSMDKNVEFKNHYDTSIEFVRWCMVEWYENKNLHFSLAIGDVALREVIENPDTTRPSIVKKTKGDATVYYNKDGSYAIKDNETGEILQVSDKNDPCWIPDSSIKDPYKP